MKKIFFRLLLISGFLLSMVSASPAQIITHTVTGQLDSYMPYGSTETVFIQDPETIPLFDVTFDDSSTTWHQIDGDGNIIERSILDMPDAAFVSDASFVFSPEMFEFFVLLGISWPSETTHASSMVMGMYSGDGVTDPWSFQYSLLHSMEDGGSLVFLPYPARIFLGDEPKDGYGMVYEMFSFVSSDAGSFFSFGDYSAYFSEVEYTAASTASTPVPSALLLLGTGLAGLAGMRRRRMK